MTDTADLLVDCRCALGEGPFWHTLRNELFWFDINNRRLFSVTADGLARGDWTFPEIVSAAAIIDEDTIAIATETGLKRFSLTRGLGETLVDIEADETDTRSNDGRVDRAGGFWIGTMTKDEDEARGKLYRYRRGRIDVLRENIKVPNSICFSPDGGTAYFSDTPSQKILKIATDPDTGEPKGAWEVFADVSDHRGFPDGSVVDSEGYLWNARWGGSCVVRHAPDGSIDRIIELPVSQVTCPAFGGTGYRTLFITTANKTLSPEQLAREPHAGSVFAVEVETAGLPDALIEI